ncbi:hypothetical protein THMIRHAM_21160 [Thiomicrorhabdus immobilis]|uniref:Type II secretion system protein GspC N-terminal domain-containing protein n=2 Tax=Thiomicrorhabdus immobilis TaxID=2791037 RepID=A0ABM7MFV1_9GAMM|nr:hypothetical protein THMIRHAM_21160 [Thiomicrorhabdus immobilis]
MPVIQSQPTSASVSGVASPIYLFGRAPIASDQPLLNTENVQKTRLNLKLLGVLVAPNNSIAIIEKGSQNFSFSLEETIQDGVVLKEVHSDYVVISHNGLLETLQMVEGDVVFSQGEEVSVDLTEKQLQTLKTVKENAIKNPISIMRYVRFQMVQKDGKVTAVKVWPQAEREIFASLGFEPGDELKMVSGYAIEELVKSPTLWQELLQKTDLDLTIERNGQEQSVLVQLD